MHNNRDNTDRSMKPGILAHVLRENHTATQVKAIKRKKKKKKANTKHKQSVCFLNVVCANEGK